MIRPGSLLKALILYCFVETDPKAQWRDVVPNHLASILFADFGPRSRQGTRRRAYNKLRFADDFTVANATI